MSKISAERLAEMVGAGVPCVPAQPGEIAAVVQELRRLRSQPAGVRATSDQLLMAVLDCPHTIEGGQIVLRIDPKRDGNATAQLHARLRALEPQQEEAVAGWVLVPKEPTLDQRKAGYQAAAKARYQDPCGKTEYDQVPREVYYAMIASAPAHPNPVQKVQESQTVSVTDEMVERFNDVWAKERGLPVETLTAEQRERWMRSLRAALTTALEPSHVR